MTEIAIPLDDYQTQVFFAERYSYMKRGNYI